MAGCETEMCVCVIYKRSVLLRVLEAASPEDEKLTNREVIIQRMLADIRPRRSWLDLKDIL